MANPTISRLHTALIRDLVARFEQPMNVGGVLWQRAPAPITTEAVELIAEALCEKLALVNGACNAVRFGAHSLEAAPMLPSSASLLKIGAQRAI